MTFINHSRYLQYLRLKKMRVSGTLNVILGIFGLGSGEFENTRVEALLTIQLAS